MGLAHSPRIVTDELVLALDAGNTKSYPGSGTTWTCILYTSPSPRDMRRSRMPSSA